MTLPDGLLEDAKNYLDMTWRDPEGERRLAGILARGMTYLERAAGAPLDFSEGTSARALLYDYARYVRAGALQDFAGDFQAELLGLHIENEVLYAVLDRETGTEGADGCGCV